MSEWCTGYVIEVRGRLFVHVWPRSEEAHHRLDDNGGDCSCKPRHEITATPAGAKTSVLVTHNERIAA